MNIQKRLLHFITRANWYLFFIASALGFLNLPFDVFMGILCGGLIVTVNFHLLSRTLKRALTPPNLTSHNVIIAKYYIRFIISGFIIFMLISKHIVDPIGLILGLSVVVVSIVLATVLELTKQICREAV
ncbi:MAG: ATP synthase subunit I [Proteobacteria bacterium]|nr:ATP synthase subunit I [Pseudomonadota bacterium]